MLASYDVVRLVVDKLPVLHPAVFAFGDHTGCSYPTRGNVAVPYLVNYKVIVFW